MKKNVLILTLLLNIILILSASAEGYSFQKDYEAIDEQAKSVFYVEVYGPDGEAYGTASGFIAFDEHFFVTNQHVIEGASYLKIWDEEEKEYRIDGVVVSDRASDLAILAFPDGRNYRSLSLNIGAKLLRGQPVTTIGSPQGMQNTVAFGNISALPQIENRQMIQFTAPMSQGSSGGTLFDDNGRVIGITSAILSEGENIGFAIRVDELNDLYKTWDGHSYQKLGTEKAWDTVSDAKNPTADAPQDMQNQIVPPATDGVVQSAPAITTGRISKDSVNIRKGPSQKSEKVDTLSKGTLVEILDEVESDGAKWYRILFGNKKEGYVRGDLLSPDSASGNGSGSPGSSANQGQYLWFDDRAEWKAEAGDTLSIRFNMRAGNQDIYAFELYVFATDVWAERLYDGAVYYGTTLRNISAGKTAYSDYITIPESSSIYQVYAGIKKVKLQNGRTIEFNDDEMDFCVWNVKN